MNTCNCNTFYLSKEELLRVENVCHDKNFSKACFLKEDQSLLEVCKADRDYLESVKISPKQISDRMKYIVKLAFLLNQHPTENYIGKDVPFIIYGNDHISDERYTYETPDYIVRYVGWMGAQTCPFQSPEDKHYYGYEYGCSDFLIINKRTGKHIQFNSLLWHMIEIHTFFEGPQTLYRVEPSIVIDVLDIHPGVDYSPEYTEENVWELKGSGSYDEEKEIIKKIALETYIIEHNVIGYKIDHKTYYESSKYTYDVLYVFSCHNPTLVKWFDNYEKDEMTIKTIDGYKLYYKHYYRDHRISTYYTKRTKKILVVKNYN